MLGAPQSRRAAARCSVPVLEGEGAPVGHGERGDLIYAKRAVGESRRQAWLELLAEGGSIAPAFLTRLQSDNHTAVCARAAGSPEKNDYDGDVSAPIPGKLSDYLPSDHP